MNTETLKAPIEDTPTETPVETPEATETTEPKKEPELTPEQVDEEKKVKTQEAFNKQYGKTKQAERERDALQEQINEANKAQNVPPPEVGSFPNEFDYDSTEDFEAAKTNFVNNVKANATHQANIDAVTQQQQNAQLAAQQQQQTTDNEMAQKLLNKAKSYNITEQDVQQHAQTVINYGIDPNAFRMIAGDEESPLILKHLASNSQDVAALSTMNPYEAGVFIMNTIKPKAIALKPKASNAPAPGDDIEGGNADLNRDDPLIKGATFT